MEYTEKTPKVRFPEFQERWFIERVEKVVDRISIPVEVNKTELYTQIGIRSHGKGIFHKEPVSGESLGNKRVYWIVEDALILNIVFAWEQAVAKTSKEENGMIASHRFPMYKAKEQKLNIDYLLLLFLTVRGKKLLSLASPGGAGRNKTLGQKEFEKLKIFLPPFPEQNKISYCLTTLSNNIQSLEQKKKLLERYKEGIMQKIFNLEIRFKSELHIDYPDWKSQKLKEVFRERKVRNKNSEFNEVFSVTKSKGIVNQIEHLGRSYASSDITNYKTVFPGDVVYTKSPTSNFPFGIIKQNKTDRTGVVSVLYGVFIPSNIYVGELIDSYFSSWKKTYNYLNPIVHKGAKNTMNIGNDDFLNGKEIFLPSSIDEMIKINNFFKALDKKIAQVDVQLLKNQQLKKGFLQKMFI